MTSWVADASPLIFLSHLGRLNLLRTATREVYIPRAVAAELAQKRDAASAAVQAACETWLRIRDIASLPQGSLDTLGRGEAEAILLAEEVQAAWLVMDDATGRKVAARRGLRIIGTVGILLAAKRRSEIDRLLELGFRVSPRLVAAVLEEADEA